MEAPEDELCFPMSNNSCRKTKHSNSEAAITYTVLSVITVLTVVLNLLVIISISHYRQLHTSSNLLLLSLAVADLIVGLLEMPVEILFFRGCFSLGDFVCILYCLVSYLVISVSVGNMVMISIDRYIAICDPMLYPTKVTVKRVQVCICLCWIFSAIHAIWIPWEFIQQPNMYNSCLGECVFETNQAESAFDLVVTFVAPISVITVLYLRVFVVAVSQARAMRSQVVSVGRSGAVKKSELKAARNLGVVIVAFIICSCPFYTIIVLYDIGLTDSAGTAELWLIYFNSCINPIIYAFSYPWFRRSIKNILTLQILQPGSSEINIL